MVFPHPQAASEAVRLSKGAAAISKLTLNPPQFWELTLPLPRIGEQRRIVARIEELAAKIDEARELRRQSKDLAQALLTGSIEAVMNSTNIDGHLGDVLLAPPRNGWSARCDNAEQGTPVLSLGAITGFRYRSSEFKRTSEATLPGAHYWLRPGDLLMTRSNTRDLVGHAAVYDGTPYPCIYPDLMMRLEVNDRLAYPRFVHYWLQSRTSRAVIEAAAKGTNDSMVKISQSVVTNLPYPTSIPLPEQRRIVTFLDDLSNKTQDLKGHQAATGSELDALLPAVLDRAFRGEL